MRNLLRALGCQFIEPIDELGIAATLLDETAQAIAAIAYAIPIWVRQGGMWAALTCAACC